MGPPNKDGIRRPMVATKSVTLAVMFDAPTEEIRPGRVTKYRIVRENAPMSFGEALRSLRGDPEFRAFLTSVLASSPFDAFRWETPGTSQENVDNPFSFVLLNAPGLARPADPAAFAEHFAGQMDDSTVLSFPNLGKNAQMIVPRPTSDGDAYTHLASFLREGPPTQIDDLWRFVGEETIRMIGREPRWLSTAGGGVAWLHVRLDTTPKYYGHEEYKTPRRRSVRW